ncbi:MAG: hypothetical protein ABIG11_09650 [bacterium]
MEKMICMAVFLTLPLPSFAQVGSCNENSTAFAQLQSVSQELESIGMSAPVRQTPGAIAGEALAIPTAMRIADVRGQGKTKVEITDKAVSWMDGGRLYSYIPGLEKDLFQEFITKPSRGPGWKEAAVQLLEKEFDFHEQSSYWGESYEGGCDGFSEDELEEAESSYKFEWVAVKPLRGSQTTVMYIMEYYTVLNSGNKTCKIPEQEHLFLNKIVEGAPVYLGIREYKVPAFIGAAAG